MKCPAALSLVLALLAPTPALAAPASRVLPVGEAHAIRLEGAMQIEITTRVAPSLRATGEAVDLESLDASVSDGVLTIRRKPTDAGSFAPQGAIRLAIGLRDLDQLTLVGGGSVDAKRLRTTGLTIAMSGPATARLTDLDVDRLALKLLGSGNATLTGRAGELLVRIVGPASLDAAALDAQGGKLTVEGAALVRLKSRGAFAVTAGGQASVTVEGGSCTRVGGTTAATVIGCR